MDSISLDLRGSGDNPAVSAMLLYNMCTTLTRVNSLTLNLHHDWDRAPYCWQEIGSHTHLTHLAIRFDQEVRAVG